MKLLKKIILILIVFLETGNLLSNDNLFNVNNILLEKKENKSNKQLADQAIKEAFNQFLNKVLMNEDIAKISNMTFTKIKELVIYYNVSENLKSKTNEVNFSVTFDKNKVHNLFYNEGISYSDITDKEIFILPIILDENEIFIFSNNYFYENWNKDENNELIEFILPLENIEIIQKINKSRDNLFNLKLKNLFKEYSNKNLALILIENNASNIQKIYLKAIIQDKVLSKNLTFKKNNFKTEILNKKIKFEIKEELTNLIKSRNLIDIRIPSFLNVKLNLEIGNNLSTLDSKIKNIDLLENIFIQEFTNDYVKIRIKYLGKLKKIIHELKKENIRLESIGDQWFIKVL